MVEKEIDIDKLLAINEGDLISELATCPGYYSLLSQLALQAEEIYNKAVLAVEHYELDLANKFKYIHKEEQKDSQYKLVPLTETEIKRMFRGDDKWNLLKNEELKCETNYKTMEKSAKAMEMKHQSCMSINKRQIKENEI